MAISVYPQSSGGVILEKKIATFTSTGSWTAPANVTYVIAHITPGGGGGGGTGGNGSNGGSSGFASTTVNGGRGGAKHESAYVNGPGALANTGNGGSGGGGNGSAGPGGNASDGFTRMIGQSVTPLSSYTVTVGAGGSGNGTGGSGGSGFVALEYYESVEV